MSLGKISLDLPEGVITEGLFLTATPVPAEDLPNDPSIVPGTAFDFGLSGTYFLEPVTLCIQYDAPLPGDVEEEDLRVHLLVDGELIEQDAGFVDTVLNIVCAEVEHFSVFVVLPPEVDLDAPEILAEADGVSVGTDGISFGVRAAIERM